MPYQAFSPKDAALFADKHSDLFGDHSQLTAQRLGSNTLSQVFRVKNNRGTSLIVKQALPEASPYSQHWPVSLSRSQIEADVLKHHFKICPDHQAELLFYDAEQSALLLEDLSGFERFSTLLQSGSSARHVAVHVGRYLASTSFYSSDFVLTGPLKKARQAQFSNPEFSLITEDLVFTDPYCNHERNSVSLSQLPLLSELWQNDSIQAEVAQLKADFLSKPQALLHGALNCTNLMVSHEQTKVIAPQFGCYGPIAFDPGTFLASLILNFVALDPDKSIAQRQYLLTQMELFWSEFAQQFQSLMQKQTKDPSFQNSLYQLWYLQQLWQDTLGYAGCELIRRTVGWAPEPAIQQIHEQSSQLRLRQRLLSTAQQLLQQRRQLQLTDLLSIVAA